MARQGISTGTSPNSGTGDTLLSGGVKINENFSELYTLLGDGTTLAPGIVTSIIAGDNISVGSSTGQVTITASTGIANTSSVRTDTLVVTGVSTLGVVTGATYYGDGSNLTGLSTQLSQLNNDVGFVTFTNNNQLTNGAGYITTSFTNTNQLTNGAGFVTFTNTNQLTNGAGFVTFTNNNQLTNGAGYITTSFTNTNQLVNGAGFVTFTDNSQLTNGAGYITTSFTNTNQLTNGAGFISSLDGVDGSGLTGITTLISAGTNITLTTSSGITTINSSGGSGITTTNVSADTLVVSGVSTLGVVTGATYHGDASNIISGRWVLGANGSDDYTFTGPGGLNATRDPVIYLARGSSYEFVNNMGAHPFQIQTNNGGSAFTTGVTNNGASNGTVRFDVPFDAGNLLWYQCTAHAGMAGTIVVYPNLFTV